MNISPISIGSGLYPQAVGGSVEDTVNNLKNQRKDLEEQLKNGAPDVQEKINSLDKRINNLESRMNKVTGGEECQTCKNRKYKDGSDDPGVSFKTASKISGNAASAVKSHENEHVTRNRAKAEREGREIVSQTVRIKSDICPECGKSYVSGGETVTVTKNKPENPFNVGIADELKNTGSKLNTAV